MKMHTNDLQVGMEVVVFDTVTRKLVDWEWGLHNGKTFKRWFGQDENKIPTGAINNMPHIMEVK